ncbi:MAG TPA: acetate--CoA ligase family protein [Stellaceae bacterium]|nr:acetate--CoA ligase family protein [Stellaceae bacterium]
MTGRTDRDRALYSRADLTRLIDPRAVAVIGVSANPGGFGSRTLANLAGFGGRVYAINPKYRELHGVRCYADLAALPEVPDCVVIALPREAVESAVEDCAARGVGGVVIYASGYSETGLAERKAQQERLAAIAAASRGMRIVGPNCFGIANNLTRAAALFIPRHDQLPHHIGPVGIVSQSGALGYTAVQASERGVGYSHYLAAGNSCDVDVCDFASYLVEAPECRAIALCFEGVTSGARLLALGEKAVRADKPIVVYKVANGAASAAAALSHTGTLAGSDAAYRAAFERGRFIVVDDLEALFETAQFFAKAGRPKAPGVAVMATSGGAAVITADMAETFGVPIPQPGEAAQRILAAAIPDYGSTRNPCDVTAQVINDQQSLIACCTALLEDPAYGTLVLPQVMALPGQTPARVPLMSELSLRTVKPICIIWQTEWLQGPGADLYENDPRVALFRSSRRCFATLAAWHRHEALRSSNLETPTRSSPPEAAASAAKSLAAAEERLTEREAKGMLALYGVPVTGERLAESVEEAAVAAAEFGYPVALKIESPDIAHKTEAGVIRLDLRDAAALRRAYEEITEAAARVTPRPRINGVLVQPMAPKGVELVIGARVDPQFGPLVVVGSGGILVELLRDSVVALAPVGRKTALAMLQRLKGARLLTGFRGSAPVDLAPIADAVCRVSELIADHRDAIAEIDVNPLICSAAGPVAVDALIVRTRQDNPRRIA